MSDLEENNGSDGEEEQQKGNMFLAQAAMKSKLTLEDQKKLTCIGCNKDIWPKQDKISADKGKTFHAECFKCEVCKCRLSTKFSALKGHFYCTPHYTELLRAAGGKVDAVVGTDRSTVEQAREAARNAASSRTTGIQQAEQQGRGANWAAAKANADKTVEKAKSATAEHQTSERLASERAAKATSSSGQAIRAKFAPPKPAAKAPPAGPGGRGKFAAPPPKFDVDEGEEEKRKQEEEERRKEEEAAKEREEADRRAEDERRAEEERQKQQQEEEERQRQEEEERQRQEAEAAAAAAAEEVPQDAPAEEAPAEEAPAEGGDFVPVPGKRWERIEHEDGDVYFYNHETGESVWEQPEDYDG
jgi:hypothetical protein